MDPRHKLYKTLETLSVDPEQNSNASMNDKTKIEASDQASDRAADSRITADLIKQKLEQVLEASHVEIEDMSGGCGQMFEAVIVSSKFSKKTTLARHRLVNSALKQEIANIHAWTPRCYTTEEWEDKKS